jgi:dolichyl-phosphate-mannose--protein O-mannosyl transferase
MINRVVGRISRITKKQLDIVLTTCLVVLAGLLRFVNLGNPKDIVFDETYYVKDAWSLVQTGAERNWPTEGANQAFQSGDVNSWLDTKAYVVHPEVGKWLIALGEKLAGGGANPVGWRLAVAILGTLSVLLIIRTVKRMFNSVWCGALAGLLLAIDGVAIVLSRTGILDMILSFFLLLGFYLLIVDKQKADKMWVDGRLNQGFASSAVEGFVAESVEEAAEAVTQGFAARSAEVSVHAVPVESGAEGGAPQVPVPVDAAPGSIPVEGSAPDIIQESVPGSIPVEGKAEIVGNVDVGNYARIAGGNPSTLTIATESADSTPLRVRHAKPKAVPLVFRPYRLLAIAALALAVGVKWSGLYFIAIMLPLSVFWDLFRYGMDTDGNYQKGTIKKAIKSRFAIKWLLKGAIPTAIITVFETLAIYLATWTSWFINNGYDSDWAKNNPGEGITWLPNALNSFIHYQSEVYKFHTGLTSPHTYASDPLSWLFQIRPVSFYYETLPDGKVADILCLGNPLIWWLSSISFILLFAFLGFSIIDKVTQNPMLIAIICAMFASWGIWLQYPSRTMFSFYGVAFLPYLIMCFVYVVNRVIKPQKLQIIGGGQVVKYVIFAAVLVAIVYLSVYFYPIWTASPISSEDWSNRMWFNSWI